MSRVDGEHLSLNPLLDLGPMIRCKVYLVRLIYHRYQGQSFNIKPGNL